MMLLPQSRLLFWFSLVVIPFSVLGAVYPEAAFISMGFMGLWLFVGVIDAVLALDRLKGLKIELPPLLRFSRGRPGVISVILHHSSTPTKFLRLGLVLPQTLRSESEEKNVAFTDDPEPSRIDWDCRPTARGRYLISRAVVETTSRLGWWAVRRTLPVQCEVRVYPNLLLERRSLAALFLNRAGFGIHTQRQVGKGRDFEKLREYIPGDGLDEIHWKATAKRSHPVTKVFQIERTQEIYVVVDASRLSARRTATHASELNGLSKTTHDAAKHTAAVDADSTSLERFITSALVLAQAAERQGDLFGVLTFTDQVRTFVRAGSGQDHYATCRDALYTVQAEDTTPDFDEIATFIRTRLRRRALVIFLTSLDDPMLAEQFGRNLPYLARQHLILVNMIRPPDLQPLFAQAEDVREVDDLYRHLAGHLQWQRLQELKKGLQRRGVRLALSDHESLATDLVSQYISVKQRQLI